MSFTTLICLPFVAIIVIFLMAISWHIVNDDEPLIKQQAKGRHCKEVK